MKKLFLFFIVLSISLFLTNLNAQNRTGQQKEINDILNASENIFKKMQDRDFKSIWQGITERSKKRIIEDVYKEGLKLSKKENKPFPLTKENIFEDFNNAGPISKAYWNSFLDNFDPKTALEQSTWKIGRLQENYGEVILHHKNSERPAILQMFKENGLWKLGLVETFWTSRR